jgi:hypothetical protein
MKTNRITVFVFNDNRGLSISPCGLYEKGRFAKREFDKLMESVRRTLRDTFPDARVKVQYATPRK